MSMRRAGSDRQVRYGRIVGLIFATAGFVVIFLGWNGMAKQACPDCQLPYLLSGGAAGLGLILFGSALLLVSSLRAERLKSDERIQELIQTTGRVGGALAARTESQNGLVVAGKSTYHRPECRLVEGKQGLDKVTVRIAQASGLTACRVCSPETLDEEAPDEGDSEAGRKRGRSKAKAEKES